MDIHKNTYMCKTSITSLPYLINFMEIWPQGGAMKIFRSENKALLSIFKRLCYLYHVH